MTRSASVRSISTTIVLLLLLASLCWAQKEANATISTIKSGQRITVDVTIVSPKGDFKLGFFSPAPNSRRRFVGISYSKSPIRSHVWIANRDYPALTSSPSLSINAAGNIVIIDGRMTYMVTNTSLNSTSKSRHAVLLDSGNLVLRDDDNPGVDLWQSFDHPTDTLLPGMMFRDNDSSLVSWTSADDPAPGNYSMRLDSARKELIVQNGNKTDFLINESEDGLLFGMVLDKGSLFFDQKSAFLELSRLVLTETGQLQRQSWNPEKQEWEIRQKIPEDVRDETDVNVLSPTTKKDKAVIIYVLIAFSGIVTLAMIVITMTFFIRKRRLERKGENLLLFDVDMSLRASSDELPDINQKGKKGRRKPFKLSFFTFASVSLATDNFSVQNKIGEGGFGPVYKGTLLKGAEVAVKRLSGKSHQGTEQFKNEAHLIARLQHKHLVRLLGCCIEKKEKILIYEYLPNKSLDYFLYDSTRRKSLTWSTRVKIIQGIAHGLLYLHQYSRIRIIHRDLKPSNVLLDNEMNPKISDFGLARIFGRNQPHENVARPAGTLGYMSPESGRHGLFSDKSDIYSFGVLFLEILSGKKNTDIHNSETRGLVAYAWELWIGDRGLEFLDPLIEDVIAMHMIIRYLHIALLCVEENASDRPTAGEVLAMLCNSSTILASPKQPGFWTIMSKPNPATTRPEAFSVNEMSVTDFEPR